MTTPKIVAVVQARMGSSRLPNKMMLSLHGLPVIEWVARRLGQSTRIHSSVFAIPATRADLILRNYLVSQGYLVHIGSESDVLARTLSAAQSQSADIVIRICADNPLICPIAIDDLIEFFLTNKLDYAYNHIPRKNLYPDGLGAEIVNIDTLINIERNASKSSHREHTFNYLWDHEIDYKIGTFDPPNVKIQYPSLKLDLDTLDDYVRLSSIDISVESPSDHAISELLSHLEKD